MTISIELPPEEEKALLERARMSGRDVASYVRDIIQDHIEQADAVGEPVDHEAIDQCAREIEGKLVPTLEEVRRALAKIPGSMAEAVIEERGERF